MGKLFFFLSVFFLFSPLAFALDLSQEKEAKAKINELVTILTELSKQVTNLEVELTKASEALTLSKAEIKRLKATLTKLQAKREQLEKELNAALKSLNGSRYGWILPAAISGAACLGIGFIWGFFSK